MKAKILIADDHTVVGLGVKATLESDFPDIIVDIATNYDAVKKCLHSDAYDLVLLDINMPGSTYTLMVSELKSIRKDVKILIFSTYSQDVALQYIRKGAEGYLNKQCSEEELRTAIYTIVTAGYYYPSEIVPLILNEDLQKNNVKSLTGREFQIFELLANGNGNLEISNILNIQNTTISTFKKKIFQKLGVTNIVELSKIYQNIH